MKMPEVGKKYKEIGYPSRECEFIGIVDKYHDIQDLKFKCDNGDSIITCDCHWRTELEELKEEPETRSLTGSLIVGRSPVAGNSNFVGDIKLSTTSANKENPKSQEKDEVRIAAEKLELSFNSCERETRIFQSSYSWKNIALELMNKAQNLLDALDKANKQNSEINQARKNRYSSEKTDVRGLAPYACWIDENGNLKKVHDPYDILKENVSSEPAKTKDSKDAPDTNVGRMEKPESIWKDVSELRSAANINVVIKLKNNEIIYGICDYEVFYDLNLDEVDTYTIEKFTTLTDFINQQESDRLRIERLEKMMEGR